MKIKLSNITIIEIIMILLVINYMVVTIIFNDNVVFKYLRDFLLVALLIKSGALSTKKTDFIDAFAILFVFCLLFGTINASSTSLAIISIRRYIFPLLLFAIIRKMKAVRIGECIELEKFWLLFLSLICLWGIFQAYVLKDEFLKQLGYPSSYSYSYGRIMLNSSYYFGGLGIQRVVTTLSNSNVCALVLGLSILLFCYNYKTISVRHKKACLSVVMIAYVLTFSRANFLSMLIVVLIVAYPYIPNKSRLFMMLLFLLAVSTVIYYVQGSGGFLAKLILWVQQSLNFTESSAAGRSNIWQNAFYTAIDNPFGIGLGHVGSLARDASVVGYLDCENSYLAITLDTGWIGFLLFILMQVCIIHEINCYERFFKRMNDTTMERLCKCCFAVYLYFAIAMFFSNHIYDMETTSLFYCIIGIVLNLCKSRKRSVTVKCQNLQ